MKRKLFLGIILCAMAVVLHAQSKPEVKDAPIPAKILQAKTVFVSNGLYEEKDPRAYQSFYRKLSDAKRYELVDDPSKADLVLEVRYENFPMKLYVELAVYDRATHYLLWSFSQDVANAVRPSSYYKNTGQSAERLVQDFLTLGKQDGTAPKP